jgi:ABC-type amino acid transport substrate-binding protein
MRRINIILLIFGISLIQTPLLAQDKLVFSTIQKSNITPLLKEVVQEAYKQIGIQVEIKEMPAARSLLELNSGRVDGELARTKYIELDSTNLIRVPIRIYVHETVAFTKKSIDINGWESLKPYRLGTIIGHKQVEKNIQEMEYSSVIATEQLFKMLNHDRIDIGITGRVNGMLAIQQLNLDNMIISKRPLAVLNLYHYLHKRNQHLVPKITEIFKKMEDEGRLQQINKQFESSLTTKK